MFFSVDYSFECDVRPYTVLQRTPDKNCRTVEVQKLSAKYDGENTLEISPA